MPRKGSTRWGTLKLERFATNPEPKPEALSSKAYILDPEPQTPNLTLNVCILKSHRDPKARIRTTIKL